VCIITIVVPLSKLQQEKRRVSKLERKTKSVYGEKVRINRDEAWPDATRSTRLPAQPSYYIILGFLGALANNGVVPGEGLSDPWDHSVIRTRVPVVRQRTRKTQKKKHIMK
jgi:hypothetical protein